MRDLTVLRPRILRVARADPACLSIGDEAVAELAPGLQEFLTGRDAHGIRLDEGLATEWMTPVGIAGTALYAVLRPPGVDASLWTGVHNTVRWNRPARAGEVLVASAIIQSLGRTTVTIAYRVTNKEEQDDIASGELVMAYVPEGRPVPIEHLFRPTPAPAPVAEAVLPALSHHDEITVPARSRKARIARALLPGPWFESLRRRYWIYRASRAHVTLGTHPLSNPLTQTLAPEGRGENEGQRRVLYVLTEDCETFDGGERTGAYGDSRILGNHNNWMDPEEYRIQMIEKPNALNRIAERYGARWTHYWTATQRFAAEWAAQRSTTGAWRALLKDLDRSVLVGSRQHEYAPHIHFDFEPDSVLPPEPRLLYDPATDGILPNEYYNPVHNPNHKYHGWDGGRKGIAYVRTLGTLTEPDSKTGSLRKSARHLSRLAFGGTYPITVRTGAADFGASPQDVAASTAALLANGFWADSDAGVNATDGAPDRDVYFCQQEDIERKIDDPAGAGLVELRVPGITFDGSTLEELNDWFDQRIASCSGPGVHIIVGMTHAMFMRGAPDPFRSVAGGDFETLDRHLRYVRTTYPAVEFATASEAVLAYLDYYAPVLRVIAGQPSETSHDGTVVTVPLQVLGQAIPVSPQAPVRVSVQVPHYFDPDLIKRVSVREKGVPVASAEPPSDRARLPVIDFSIRERWGYELEVELAPQWHADLMDQLRTLEADAAPSAVLRGGSGYDVIFQLRRPCCVFQEGDPSHPVVGDTQVWGFPNDVFRLVIHPVAGGAEPLGREFHPYGRVSEGAVVYAALERFGPRYRPVRLELKYQYPIQGNADFFLRSTVTAIDEARAVTDNSFYEGLNEVARATLTCRA